MCCTGLVKNEIRLGEVICGRKTELMHTNAFIFYRLISIGGV